MAAKGNRLKGKVALITGASGGQGAVEAQMFAREGARVVLADIDDAPGKVLAGAPGLGTPDRKLVTVVFCQTAPVREMIQADRELHPELYG